MADGSAGLNGDCNSVAESRGDQDDRRVTATVVVCQAERGTGQSWHGDVKQDEIDLAVQGSLECVLAIDRLHDAVACIFEQHRQHGADVGTVLGDEDDWHGPGRQVVHSGVSVRTTVGSRAEAKTCHTGDVRKKRPGR
jgi:hypothetical protein